MPNWLKESFRLYLSYMSVGFGVMPAAVVYATYSVFHGENMHVAVSCLAVGLVCGHFAYRWTYRKAGSWLKLC